MFGAAVVGAESSRVSQLGLDFFRDETSAMYGSFTAHRVPANDGRS